MFAIDRKSAAHSACRSIIFRGAKSVRTTCVCRGGNPRNSKKRSADHCSPERNGRSCHHPCDGHARLTIDGCYAMDAIRVLQLKTASRHGARTDPFPLHGTFAVRRIGRRRTSGRTPALPITSAINAIVLTPEFLGPLPLCGLCSMRVSVCSSRRRAADQVVLQHPSRAMTLYRLNDVLRLGACANPWRRYAEDRETDAPGRPAAFRNDALTVHSVAGISRTILWSLDPGVSVRSMWLTHTSCLSALASERFAGVILFSRKLLK